MAASWASSTSMPRPAKSALHQQAAGAAHEQDLTKEPGDVLHAGSHTLQLLDMLLIGLIALCYKWPPSAMGMMTGRTKPATPPLKPTLKAAKIERITP